MPDATRHVTRGDRSVGAARNRRRSLAVVAAGQALPQRAPRAAIHAARPWPPCSARCCWSSRCSSPASPAPRAFVTVASISVLSEDLPDPSALATLQFDQPTIVYDRTGKTELARFQRTKRTVVDYRDLPPLVQDATTTAEDRTFWENDGFDVTAMVAAAVETAQGDGRGASTITQQLVRARLLPADVIEPGGDVYLRKAKEVIQSARLTAAFPGQTGKQQILTAYLNQIFYGHDAYGIAAAAKVYFGVSDLAKLTPAQAALLAALPQSPSDARPVPLRQGERRGRARRARDRAAGRPPRTGSSRTCRRAAGRSSSAAEVQAAIAEPVVLVGDRPAVWRAPHFMWQVRRQLESILGSADAVETGGYRVITTLDWRAQQLAERSVAAAVIAPNLKRSRAERLLDQPQDRARGPRLDQRPCAARTSTTPRSSRSTTGPATSARTSAPAATTATASRAGGSTRSTTPRASGRGSRARPGSRSCTRRRSSGGP